VPNAERILFIHDALYAGFTIKEMFSLTQIDRRFLAQIKEIGDSELSASWLARDKNPPAPASQGEGFARGSSFADRV
jgi:Carbamoyl-phosphate synthetase large chain, oligomerisation domain